MLRSLSLATLAFVVMCAKGQSSVFASSDSGSSGPYQDCEKYAYSCVDKGNKCKGDFYSYESMDLCNNGNDSYSCCKMPLHCSSVTGKCVLDNAGDECTDDSDCLRNYFSSGLIVCLKKDEAENGTCVTQGNAGDSCTSDDGCYGFMKCVAKRCAGSAEGESCARPIAGSAISGVTGFSCAVNLYCDEAELVCKKRVGADGACTNDFMCAAGLVCNSGSCVERYSLSTGDNCTVKK